MRVIRDKATVKASLGFVIYQTAMIVTIIILITVLSVVACHIIAKRRGGNAVMWGVLGACFGPFAIPFAFLAGRPDPDGD